MAEEEEEPAEQTEFDVQLKDFGSKKIPVIKEVRAITGLGLKEAKEKVESAPVVIQEGIAKEEAEKTKEQLEARRCRSRNHIDGSMPSYITQTARV